MFDGLSKTITFLVLHNFKQLKRINNFGVEKLSRSLFALQQNMLGFCSIEEPRIDLVDSYLKLFSCSNDEFIKFVKENRRLFSFPELKCILDLKMNSVSDFEKKDIYATLDQLKVLFNY